MPRNNICAFAFLFLFSVPAFCAVRSIDDEPPEKYTMWDRIMRAQSYNNMSHGLQMLDAGQYRQAASEFGRAIVENPKEPWPHILLGSALYWSGQVDQAIGEYKTALKMDNTNADAWQLCGIAYAWKGDIAAAMDAFKTAVKYAPSRADVQMNLGSIYESAGDYSNALPYFRRATEIDSHYPLYWFQLGALYSRVGRDNDAVDAFKNALDDYPGYQDAMVELGAVYERLGQNKDALSLYRKAVKIKPRDYVARLRCGLLMSKMGMKKEAGEVLSQGFGLTPNKSGDGLALSISYSGVNVKPRESSAAQPSSESKPQQQTDDKSSPLDALRRNLERIPLDQELHMSVEMLFVPPPVLQKAKTDELHPQDKKLANSLARQQQKTTVLAAKREFSLPSSDAATRAKQIQSIIDELEKAIKDVPPGAEMRMALSMETGKSGALATAQTPGGQESSQSRNAQASAGPQATGESADTNAVYNPRAVGNDMGLWVMGTEWLDIVNEVAVDLENIDDNEKDPLKWEAAGLAHVILGDGKNALDDFEHAGNLGDKAQSLAGSAVAWVILGNESKAIEILKEEIALNPSDQLARENLKWLTMPSSVAPAKK